MRSGEVLTAYREDVNMGPYADCLQTLLQNPFLRVLGWRGGFRQQGRQLILDALVGKRGHNNRGLSLQNPRTTPRSALLDVKERVGSVGQPHLCKGERV